MSKLQTIFAVVVLGVIGFTMGVQWANPASNSYFEEKPSTEPQNVSNGIVGLPSNIEFVEAETTVIDLGNPGFKQQ